VEIAVSPVSLEPTACRAFNASFTGRRFGGRAPILPRGTGRPHCDFNKIGSSYRIELGVFATPHTGTGRAFCRSFHPGHGFKRVSLGKGNRSVYTLAWASVPEWPLNRGSDDRQKQVDDVVPFVELDSGASRIAVGTVS
jgi:hypothetical protein